MAKFGKGYYKPKNPQKNLNKGNIIYRSQWELKVMRFFDDHPKILHWASEPLQIPYFNPVKNKQSIYIPDFLIVYENKFKQRKMEIIEVKPSSQILRERAKSAYDKVSILINEAKWSAAVKYCKHRNIDFRIISEKDIFSK